MDGGGRPRVLIVGAGFGGIGMAIELLRSGFDHITVLDAAPEPGGTWHYNDYPGAACDVPSAFYSYSFAQRPDWTHFCSPRDEIRAYLQATARDFGVTPLVVPSTVVRSCTWDDDTAQWSVVASGPDGAETTYSADAVVLATGQLNQPALPRIEGLDRFEGVAFHSARWNHDYDLTGKRVAVIGTGASAVQFVPAIAESVGHLSVFQRTGNWFLPRQNKPYSARRLALFRRLPLTRVLFRFGMYAYTELLTLMIRHPRSVGLIGRLWSTLFMLGQLRDRTVRRAVWPRYTFGCKRILFSSKWLPALQRDNVTVVTDSIAEMTPTGPRTVDGTVHEVDCVIYGTGFRTTEFMFPMQVTGVRGRALRDVWADGARAHLGITVPGFPSLFVMYGPNTNTSGGSIVFFLEAQARYIRQAVQLQARTRRGVDVRPEVFDASDRSTQERFAGTAWLRCDSWYRDGSGRIVTNWPGYMRDYAAATRVLDPDDFALIDPTGTR